MQERMDEERSRKSADEERKRQLIERERELSRYRTVIEQQENELDAFRARLKEEHLAREKEFQRELEAREELFAEREKRLVERQREFDLQLMRRQTEAEALRAHLQNEVASREAELQQALSQLQQEKERYNEESRKKLEKTSKDYVSDALETLANKEREFHKISKTWGATGAGALIVGLVFFGYITISSALQMPSIVTWEFIAFSITKGLIAIALLAGLAKYAFLFSSSYMREALKNADRRHAINFGKFYLESYGAAADWSQVKEAFEHWNITGSDAFSRKEEAQVDVSAIEKAVSLLERVGRTVPKVEA